MPALPWTVAVIPVMIPSLFHKTGIAILAVLALHLSPAHGGGSVPFDRDVVYALEQTPLAQALSGFEFHPVANGQRIGKQYPGLSGERLGPYECLARLPGSNNKPGVYPLRVVINTQPTFYDAEGNETELEKGTVSKSERATEVTITPLPDREADTGDKNAEPILLSEVLGDNENDILQRERFYLNDKPLRIGMTAKEVEALLKPAPITRGEPVLVKATGETVETWQAPDFDLELTFVISEDDPEEKTLSSLRAGPASKVETARGLRIGHPESRVTIVYQDLISKRDSTEGEMIVIGNMYLGLFVEIKEGKAASIYLGMGAE